jgi:hypothetical protein
VKVELKTGTLGHESSRIYVSINSLFKTYSLRADNKDIRFCYELKTGYFLKDCLFLFKKSATRATMQPTMEIKTR